MRRLVCVSFFQDEEGPRVHLCAVFVQDKEGWCEPPSFELYAAKPYSLGLQDLLFSCGDELNDLHMAEMQADCLVDDDDELAVDFVVRCAVTAPVQTVDSADCRPHFCKLLTVQTVDFMPEMQADCLVDDDDELAVDFTVRCAPTTPLQTGDCCASCRRRKLSTSVSGALSRHRCQLSTAQAVVY